MSESKISKSQVLIRDATEADIGFLFNSWLKSYKNEYFSKFIPGPVYYDLHHKAIEGILKRSKVKLAVNPVDESQIYGYLVYEQMDGATIIHYCYTKEAFRLMGVQRILLEDAAIPEQFFYSHSTYKWGLVLQKLKAKPVYNPYLAFVGLNV